jgi:hypothetical protein
MDGVDGREPGGRGASFLYCRRGFSSGSRIFSHAEARRARRKEDWVFSASPRLRVNIKSRPSARPSEWVPRFLAVRSKDNPGPPTLPVGLSQEKTTPLPHPGRNGHPYTHPVRRAAGKQPEGERKAKSLHARASGRFMPAASLCRRPATPVAPRPPPP